MNKITQIIEYRKSIIRYIKNKEYKRYIDSNKFCTIIIFR